MNIKMKRIMPVLLFAIICTLFLNSSKTKESFAHDRSLNSVTYNRVEMICPNPWHAEPTYFGAYYVFDCNCNLIKGTPLFKCFEETISSINIQ